MAWEWLLLGRRMIPELARLHGCGSGCAVSKVCLSGDGLLDAESWWICVYPEYVSFCGA